MGILSGFLGLTVAFILISVVLLWYLIKANAHIAIKLLLIPLVIWYSLVLYYTPNKLMGWPTPEEWNDGSIIISFFIKEPFQDQPGGFYFLLIDDGKYSRRNKGVESTYRDIVELMKPTNIFRYKETNNPRLYFMPYDREFHKMLTQKQKKKKQMGLRGEMRLFRKLKKGGSKKRGLDKKLHELYTIKVKDKSESLKKDPIPEGGTL